MNTIDNFIVGNSDIIGFFGIYLVIIFFAVGVVLLMVALIFRNRRKALPSQKGKTEFAKFYSDPMNLLNQENDIVEDYNPSSVARKGLKSFLAAQKNVPVQSSVGNAPGRNAAAENVTVEYYFEFDDQYYLSDD